MTAIQRNVLIGIAAAVAIAAGSYYLVPRSNPLPGGSSLPTTTLTGIEGTGDYTVELVDTKPPSPDRPIVITADLSEEVQVLLRQKLEGQAELLRKEPTRVDLWLQMGVNRKIAGDFEGAIQAWEYVAAAAPTGLVATARGNLGDLYMFFIKDYAKAEANLKAAVAANPDVIDYYRNLFYLYKDIYKDRAKASAILELGLKNNPGNPDLTGLKAQL